MDYEKAYKEALERARKLYKDAITLQLEQDIKDYEQIFPELKESEDEKIRKGLIKGLSAMRDIHHHQTFSDDAININDALAWLEMQGERKQEWSEEDERMCQETIDWFEKKCFPYALEYENPARESIQWLKSLKGRVQPKPKEWNDEDDYNLQCMIAKVTYDIQKGNVGRNNELIDWLKSLKERVQPQPKQEWSEEDEFRLNRTVENIELLNDANGDILFKDIEWLKSLKDRLSKVKNC